MELEAGLRRVAVDHHALPGAEGRVEGLRTEGPAELARERLARRARRDADRRHVRRPDVGDLGPGSRGWDAVADVGTRHLVAELEEPALLDVGVFVRVEEGGDVVLDEVEPLEAAVLEQLPGGPRAAHGDARAGHGLGRAEGLIRV